MTLSQSEEIHLPNLGYLKVKIPQELFLSIQEECLQASDITHTSFTSGLAKMGVPKHFWLDKNKNRLNEYVIEVAREYLERFKNTVSMIFKSEGLINVELKPDNPWINIQNKNEFIPNHDHYGFLSYTIWINIPAPCMFEFVYNCSTGMHLRMKITLNKESEGTLIMFPSKMVHCAYPFFNSQEKRISIAGNITLQDVNKYSRNNS
jgi:hypothetical protein